MSVDSQGPAGEGANRACGPDSQGSIAVSPYHRSGRSLPMDMLRGIAILLVLGRHYVVAPNDIGLLQPFGATWTTIGWAGVDLFFVLSGFLVSGLIFAEYRNCGRVEMRRFVIRRGFKIWPPYVVYIAVVAAWLAWQNHPGGLAGVWSELWPNVFHVQNYFHTPRLHTWSLAVEEHFYLAAALGFYWVLSRGQRRRTRRDSPAGTFDAPLALRGLPVLIVGCIAGLAALRHMSFEHEGTRLNLYATHLRFDGLLIGTLLAYWTHFSPGALAPLQRHPQTLMLLGVLLAAPTLALSPEASAWTAGVGLTGVYIGFALLMLGWLNVANVYRGWGRLFASRPAALLGQVGFYSYSIYLWHVDLAQTPIRKMMEFVGPWNVSPALVWLVATAAYVVLAVVLGAVLSRWLEIPSLALRDRLFPSGVRPLAPPASGPQVASVPLVPDVIPVPAVPPATSAVARR